MPIALPVDPKVLEDRMQAMRLNTRDVARLVANIRNSREQEDERGPWTTERLYSTVRKALKEPDSSTARVLEEIIEALDGDVLVRWRPAIMQPLTVDKHGQATDSQE